MQITKTKKEHAEVVLAGTLSAKDIERHYKKAVTAAVKEVSLPGFRKGHVPEGRVIEEVGKNFLWKDAAERSLKESLEDILKQEEVHPITPLSLALKEPTYGEDVAFEIAAVTPPTVKIDDYKKVAHDALATLPKLEKEKEEKDAVRAFRTQVRAIGKMQDPNDPKEGAAKENEDRADESLSDDESKRAGFENGGAAEFFIKGEAEKAVADRESQRRRSAVAEVLIKKSIRDIPKVIIADEARALLETFKRDVKAQGLPWNDYLKRVNKTEEDVKKDLEPNAEKRIALDLIFGHIIREEKLELSDEDKKKEEEFAHKLSGQGALHDRAHSFAREQFLREKVWEVLGVAV